MPEESILTSQQETNGKTIPKRLSNWTILERVAKVTSILAIPVALGVIGWVIQNQLAERNLNRDYVQLAVSILKEPEASKIHPALRNWAVDLLNDNSPTRFSPDVVKQLKSGEATLPANFGAALRSVLTGGVIAIAPDGKYALAGNEEGNIKVWDLSSGKEIQTWRAHTAAITSVAISPDGKLVASGSADRTVKLWDLTSGSLVRTFRGHTAEVTGVAFSPDGKFILSGSLDKSVKRWEINTGKPVRDVLLSSEDI
jgi:WD40 repeat protein